LNAPFFLPKMNLMESTEEKIETLRTWIDACPEQSCVFFGGAGVSTESGIPDFRGSKGIYTQSPSPEELISHSYFAAHPQEFFDFYFSQMVYAHALPNAAHKKLASLEQDGKLISVITQNIDGLHQKAGSKNVRELHGSIHRNYCMDCEALYTLAEILTRYHQAEDGIPRCPHCGGIIKPDVVLYEESLSFDTIRAAVADIEKADLLIVGGTSLAVYPAAGLIKYFFGSHLVIINMTPTPQDASADLCIAAPIGEVFDF
jgi:NAD-dependent deacetylase